MRVLRLGLSVVAVIALGCGGDSGVPSSGFDVGAEFARVSSSRAELAAAQERLRGLQAAAPASVPSGSAAAAAVRDAQADVDAAYARNQRNLARFLTTALNQAPRRPETRRALDMYAADAAANARYTLEHDGDRRAALAGAENARRAYVELGLGVPGELASAIESLRRTLPAAPAVSPTRNPDAPTPTAPRRTRGHRPKRSP